MLKYYRKLSPDTKPMLGNGAKVTFKTNDHVWGYFATDNEYIQGEFKRLSDAQKYGVEEISAEVFTNDYLSKKNELGISPKPWREEMGSGPSAFNQISKLKEKASAVVAVKGSDVPQPKPLPVTAATPAASQVVEAQPAKEFAPKTGKRGQIKKTA